MPKGLVLTALGNRIEYATYKKDSSGLIEITGNREDVTNDALKCVMHHLANLYPTSEISQERGYVLARIEGLGDLRFYPEEKAEAQK